MITYLDFRITFHPEIEGRFPVDAHSDLGDAKGSFQPPFELKRANSLVRELKQRLGEPSAQKHDEHIGELLFRALIDDGIAALFYQTLAIAENSPDTGIRIRIQMDIEDPGLAELSALPWELLADHSRREFISLKTRSQIVRYLDLNRKTSLQTITDPFRVLVAFANPTGTFSIDDTLVQQERALFENTMAGRDDVEITIIENASLASVRRALSESEYHAFHYLGHGSFMRGAGEGSLNFESDTGDRSLNQVDGTRLGVLFEGYPSIQLIVLNACKSAQASTKEDQDAFHGVAPALLMSGIPAVIAMQYIISVEAAVAFSSGFYPQLVRTGCLDQAMAEGRKYIFETGSRDIEWATPVLFMRSQDGRLFDRGSAAASAASRGSAAASAASRGTAAAGVASRGTARGSVAGHVAITDRAEQSPTHAIAESPVPREELPVSVGALVAAALQRAADPAISEQLKDLKQSLSAAFPESPVMRAFEKLSERPDSGPRQSVLDEELDAVHAATNELVARAARRLYEALQEQGASPGGVHLNVSGKGHVFSATGNVNIGGSVKRGDSKDQV